MTTLTIGGGKQILTLNDGAVTLFDAVTNDPFFLSDYIPGQPPTTSRAYPLRIDAAASGAVWNGGRLYGNIAESAARNTVYNSGNDDFNSALMFIRNGTNLTIRNSVFGVEGNRGTGFIDGIRASQAGNVLIEDVSAWYARDDFIEADGGGSLTINRMYGEDLYVWISCTNGQTSKVIRATDCLIRIHKWRELEPGDVISGREEFQCGPVFKTGGGSPQWIFTNVALATPRRWPENGYARTIAGLNRMSCVNCTWLSYEGTLDTTSGLRDAVLAAGWNLVEGAAAEAEWQSRKAAWFASVEPPPPPPPISLTSPCTFSVNVSATATEPAILNDAEVISSASTAQTSFTSSSVAPAAGTNRCAVLLVSTKANGTGSLADIAASWNGVPMTRLAIATFGNSANPGSAIFYLQNVDIPASAGTISVTATLMDGCYARLIQFEGIDQITPLGTPDTSNVNSSITGTDTTVNITEATSWMVSVMTANGTSGGFTLSAGTKEYDVEVGTVLAAAGATDDVGATGNRVHEYTLVGVTTRRLAVVGAELFAAG